MISKVAKSNIKNILYVLFCLLSISIPFKVEVVEAKVEKIGTKDLKILLSEDYDVKGVYKLTLPLINTSDKDQQVYYELSGFKTKENRTITVKLYEADRRNPSLIYSGAPVITEKYSTFPGGAEKSITLEFIFNQVSDEYSGKLTICSLSTKDKPSTSATGEVSFTFTKFMEPKKDLPEKALEVNLGSNEPIRINKVIRSKVISWIRIKVINLFYSEGDESKRSYNINLANKTIL